MAKRERNGDEGDNKSGAEWMATFSDLITLLITFFVLLLSMSSLDAKSLKRGFGFFDGALGVLAKASEKRVSRPMAKGAQPVVKNKSGQQSSQDILNNGGSSGSVLLENTSGNEHGEGSSDVPVQGEESSTESIPEILREVQWLLKRTAPGAEMTLQDDFRKMLELLNERSPQLQAEVDMVQGTLKVKCAADLIFVPGDVVLKQASLAILSELAMLLDLTDARVRVVGFAGDLPLKPRLYKDRWDLAVARSANVVRYLTHFEGISPARLTVAGYALPDGSDLSDAVVVFEFVHLVR